VLPADTQVAAGDGTATLSGVKLVTAGAQTVTVTDKNNSAISGSVSITVAAVSSVIHYSLSAPAQVTSHANFSVTLHALDSSNNAATGYSGTVHFTSSDASAVLPADTAFPSGSGTLTISGVDLVTAGTQTLTVTDASSSAITASASISVTAAVTPCAITAPATATPNSSVNASVTVVSGLTYQWAITNGSFTAPSTGSLVTGTAVTFTVGTASPVTLTCVATNSSNAQSSPASVSITVAAAGALSIVIAQQDPAYTPGAGTVQAGDAPLTITALQGGVTPVDASWAAVNSGVLANVDGGTVSSADQVKYTPPAQVSSSTTQAITATVASASASATLTLVPYGTWGDWSLPPDAPSNYTDKGNGTVLDNTTGLLWQQSQSSANYAWGNASLYCKGLSLGGYSSGWRLPTLMELLSIVDHALYAPAINGTFFPASGVWYTWTSSPAVGNAGYYWTVEFADGSTAMGDPSSAYDVRCVH
jgi:hypothetical protein